MTLTRTAILRCDACTNVYMSDELDSPKTIRDEADELGWSRLFTDTPTPGTVRDFCPEHSYKEPNAKGVRHHFYCFHDEPGITQCTCEPIRPAAPQEVS